MRNLFTPRDDRLPPFAPATAIAGSDSPTTVFGTFNESYVARLRTWGLFDGTVDPVARSNVCRRLIRLPCRAFTHSAWRIGATRAERHCRQRRGAGRIDRKLCSRAEYPAKTGAICDPRKGTVCSARDGASLECSRLSWIDRGADLYRSQYFTPFCKSGSDHRGAARSRSDLAYRGRRCSGLTRNGLCGHSA